MACAFVVDSEDRGAVQAAVGCLGIHDLLVWEHFGKGVVEGFYWVAVTVEEGCEEFVGLLGMFVEVVGIICVAAKACANVNTLRDAVAF